MVQIHVKTKIASCFCSSLKLVLFLVNPRVNVRLQTKPNSKNPNLDDCMKIFWKIVFFLKKGILLLVDVVESSRFIRRDSELIADWFPSNVCREEMLCSYGFAPSTAQPCRIEWNHCCFPLSSLVVLWYFFNARLRLWFLAACTERTFWADLDSEPLISSSTKAAEQTNYEKGASLVAHIFDLKVFWQFCDSLPRSETNATKPSNQKECVSIELYCVKRWHWSHLDQNYKEFKNS